MEYYTRTWYGKKIWRPYITWAGLDTAFPFKTPENALHEAGIQMKNELANYQF